MASKQPKPLMVIAIDPGNESAGVAFIKGIPGDNLAVGSLTHAPWDWESIPMPMMEGSRVQVFVEQPQHGAHKSRGGVERSGGMVLRALPKFPREKLTLVTPSQWRDPIKLFHPEYDETKEGAIKLVRKIWEREVQSHDEAEAMLIALYGWMVATKSLPAMPVRRRRRR